MMSTGGMPRVGGGDTISRWRGETGASAAGEVGDAGERASARGERAGFGGNWSAARSGAIGSSFSGGGGFSIALICRSDVRSLAGSAG